MHDCTGDNDGIKEMMMKSDKGGKKAEQQRKWRPGIDVSEMFSKVTYRNAEGKLVTAPCLKIDKVKVGLQC